MSDWIDTVPGLAELEATARSVLMKDGQVLHVETGDIVFSPGLAPSHWLLLISGVIKVRKLSESGREIVLYRVNAGESCILTTACIFADQEYAAEGVAEAPSEAIAISKGVFDEMVSASATFRRLVFDGYANRITDLFAVVDAVAFQRVDQRLARTLLDLASPEGRLNATHSTLAVELGTAREVVTRQLRDFQRREWIEGSRGEIMIKNAAALRQLVDR